MNLNLKKKKVANCGLGEEECLECEAPEDEEKNSDRVSMHEKFKSIAVEKLKRPRLNSCLLEGVDFPARIIAWAYETIPFVGCNGGISGVVPLSTPRMLKWRTSCQYEPDPFQKKIYAKEKDDGGCSYFRCVDDDTPFNGEEEFNLLHRLHKVEESLGEVRSIFLEAEASRN
ncbi:hypothetical protein K7X08_028210 [Anisodus acutangulus]|uniref:Uncharacterized protein n=1 Tax=Anisodus acutangulus TaxID=402998 RepID=A0A9Q1RQW3_9SOLA|nr:hypothetical protein K7X08_028210 [Anisodus acutangulus]